MREIELLELVRKAQQGEEQAFETICYRFAGLVKKHAFQPHLRPLVEEAQAQGWLAVTEAVKSYDKATNVPVAGYIESRVRFALWNLFKRERRRWQNEVAIDSGGDTEEEGGGLLAVLATADDVQGLVERHEIGRELTQALAALPERQRLAIAYTVIGEMRLQEAACHLGVSLQAVHSLRQRGLKRMGSLLALPH